MISGNFLSSAERLELEACVRGQRKDHGIARRAKAVLLLDDGESCAEIEKYLYLDDDTIRGRHKTYRKEGWDALSTDGWKGGQTRMTAAQEDGLCAWLGERFCRSTAPIGSHIASQFGFAYSHSGCIKLLARLGFEYRKPKALPQGSSAEKQAALIALYEGLMTTLGADEAVYFADAVHPEYQTKPAFGWVKVGSNLGVPTTAGQGCVNIHGALNLETFDAPFCEPTTVDGISAVQLPAKIEVRNPEKRIIYVIWDNAAYHKGRDVKAFLARPGCRIHFIQLPPHYPHLNPIERLWAVMHQKVTHNRYYRTQKEFANAIMRFFRETIPREWKTFRGQIADNFRIITHAKVRVLGSKRYIAIEEHGRMAWQKSSGYNQRSRGETLMGRRKAVIGPRLKARTVATQKTEAGIGVRVLNRMTALGRPNFERTA
jgi:transposase